MRLTRDADDGSDFPDILFLHKDVHADMGEPEVVTLTVVAGDKLNT